MSEVSIEPLLKADTEYKQLSDTLNAKFNCAWDDSVHESFRGYVIEVEKISEMLDSTKKTAESILALVESLRVDELEHKVDTLINEVNAV